jgi:hypothetical protein
MRDKDYLDIREKLEGKTILKVEQPDVPGAKCIFILENGERIRLNMSSEFGVWVNEAANIDGSYPSIDSLCDDYLQHLLSISKIVCSTNIDESYFEELQQKPSIVIDHNQIIVSSPYDGKKFIVSMTVLSEQEKVIVNNISFVKHFCECLNYGGLFSAYFGKYSNQVPEELKLRNAT